MTQNMFTIYFSWWRNKDENFRVPTTSAKVKVATAEKAFGVWNNKDSTFQFKLPSGICTADVTFMGTSCVHMFHFTSDSAQASHVASEHLDYDHTTDTFLLDCTFIHRSKHPQVVELPLPRVTGFTNYYNPTRPSHLVGGALVSTVDLIPPQKLDQGGLLVWNKVPHTFLEELILLLEHLVG